MQNEAKARQLVAKLMFDLDSVRLCDQDLLNRLKEVSLVSDIAAEKLKSISDHSVAATDPEAAPDTTTNYDLFRIYVERYLRQRSDLHQKRYYILVRTLEPEAYGLPMQIFAYTRETGLIDFSNTQSSTLSHLIVMARIFGLNLFQNQLKTTVNK
jgi:miniconductance mechanosensitive channel